MADATSLRRKVETRAGFIAQRLALDVKGELMLSAGRHTKSGKMLAAIATQHSRSGPTRWRVHARVPVLQAATTNKGARPHVIVPRSKRALSFMAGGNRVTVRSVNHPGNRGSHWFDEVMNVARVRSILARFVGR